MRSYQWNKNSCSTSEKNHGPLLKILRYTYFIGQHQHKSIYSKIADPFLAQSNLT